MGLIFSFSDTYAVLYQTPSQKEAETYLHLVAVRARLIDLTET